jgi:hypothetical protein
MTALVCMCLCAPADLTPTVVVGYYQLLDGETGPPVSPPLLGYGYGPFVVSTYDIFVEYNLGELSGPVTTFTLSGSVDNLRNVGGFPQTFYATGGTYAYLNVNVRAISPATTDAAGLFNASGVGAGTFTVDDGLTPPAGWPSGGGANFTLSLSPQAIALAEADRLAGRPFWLSFAAAGQAYDAAGPPFLNIVGDLSFSATVPEPASLGLMLLGLPLLRRRR